MKRYIVFAYEDYYPVGGWNDFRGSFDHWADAENFRKNIHVHHSHIVDIKTGKVLVRQIFSDPAEYFLGSMGDSL